MGSGLLSGVMKMFWNEIVKVVTRLVNILKKNTDFYSL